MKLIVTADWHLRTDRPRCRIDDNWLEAQRKVIQFCVAEASKRHASLLISGDLFDRAKSSIELVNFVLSELQWVDPEILAIPGNHDLLYHNLENIEKSAYGILQKSQVFCENIAGGKLFPFGTDTTEAAAGQSIISIHRLILPKDPGFNMGSGWNTADEILDMYPDAKWIFTGDYHENFVHEKDGRYLVNPGSLMRQSASQREYQPVIYFVDTETEEISVIPVPDPVDMVVSDYLLDEKERDERIQSFVSKVKNNSGIGLSFEENLEAEYLERAKIGDEVPQNVKDMVMEVIQ